MPIVNSQNPILPQENMTPKSKRILIVAPLLIAAIGIGTWLLLGQKNDTVDTPPATGRSVVPPGEASKVATADTAVALPANQQRTTAVASNSKTSAPSGFRPALISGNIQSLMSSADLVRIDYAMLRVRSHCLSAPGGQDATKGVREMGYTPSTFKGAYALAVGNASDEVRTAAYARSYDRCRGFVDPPLSDKEFADLTKLPISSKAMAIMQQLRNASDFENAETKQALTLAVNGPMFGALEAVIMGKVDFTTLSNSYSAEQMSTLTPFITDILLCRMGDDCGVGGIITEQLCWQNGICGGSVEEAIMTHLRASGLDTAALNQFVNKMLLALQASDTSIFRKPKPRK